MNSVRKPLVVGLFAALVASGADPSTHNLEEIASMPRERRLALHQALQRFDALPSDERQRIRDLDRQLQEMPASDRQRLYTLMRSYHDWLAAQPEPIRQSIALAAPAGRIATITRIRSQQAKARSDRRGTSEALQVSSLVGQMPRQLAVEIRFWFSLPPEERNRVIKQPNEARQKAEFQKLARQSDVYAQLQKDHKRALKKELASLRDDVRHRRRELMPRLRPFEIPKTPPKERSDSFRRTAEWIFLVNYDPQPVSQRNLDRFLAALPPWARSDSEALPPEAARHRLLLLYRLVFPAPEELPEPPPPSKNKPAARPANPAPPPPSAPGTAF